MISTLSPLEPLPEHASLFRLLEHGLRAKKGYSIRLFSTELAPARPEKYMLAFLDKESDHGHSPLYIADYAHLMHCFAKEQKQTKSSFCNRLDAALAKTSVAMEKNIDYTERKRLGYPRYAIPWSKKHLCARLIVQLVAEECLRPALLLGDLTNENGVPPAKSLTALRNGDMRTDADSKVMFAELTWRMASPQGDIILSLQHPMKKKKMKLWQSERDKILDRFHYRLVTETTLLCTHEEHWQFCPPLTTERKYPT